MQSIHSSAAHEPSALNEAMDEDELTGNVHSLLAQIPFIRGVNNHMGSHLTEFDFFMRPVMDSIRSYDPSFRHFFSSTVALHRAASPIRRPGMPASVRFHVTSSSTMIPALLRSSYSTTSG